ncbi:Phosphoglycolate phosphatase (EC [Olavius algarvensis associated proteobacterium Delta 3]|nr:Phosphoglycolate phosphatase (EC [Olavius algarvensis associated proteobacterium Delta 3]
MTGSKVFKDIRVVAFDCDGVLFDTEEANTNYYNRLLERFGLPPMTPEQFAYVHMHTAEASIAFLFAEETMLAAARAYAKEMTYFPFLKYMEMEPALVPLLKKIRPSVKTAIATNRSDTMLPLLEKFRLDAYFDLVVRSIDVKRPKPHPDMLIKVLDNFDVMPNQLVYVGDSLLDEQTASAAEVQFVAYKNPSLSAALHIDSLQTLETLVNGGVSG